MRPRSLLSLVSVFCLLVVGVLRCLRHNSQSLSNNALLEVIAQLEAQELLGLLATQQDSRDPREVTRWSPNGNEVPRCGGSSIWK